MNKILGECLQQQFSLGQHMTQKDFEDALGMIRRHDPNGSCFLKQNPFTGVTSFVYLTITGQIGKADQYQRYPIRIGLVMSEILSGLSVGIGVRGVKKPRIRVPAIMQKV